MYAFIETGGKQYKVEKDHVIVVEKLPVAEGETVTFDKVLFVRTDDQTLVGQPHVTNAKVKGKVLEHGRGKKITVFKYKPKKNYKRKQGHRQPYSRVLIESIEVE